MSKIFKALEKAERERGKERDLRIDLLAAPDTPKEPEQERAGLEHFTAEQMVEAPQWIVSFQQNSQAAEQFRKLRSQILKLTNPDSPRTIMVTSAMNGEGKTYVAANLAAGIARHLHKQALLVDCDLRNPSLSEWFNLPKAKGFSDYLAGDGTPSEYTCKTGLEKLRVLPAGNLRQNPTELVGSKRMEAFLRELKSQLNDRYVIFDSTPVLATTEPEVLARLVDGILLVVRAGSTPRETVQQAIRSIGKEKIIGVVLNDLVFKSSALNSRYFGSDGYYNRYRYGYGEKHAETDKKWWQKLLRKWKQ
jgi:protein-tyrosine kinase